VRSKTTHLRASEIKHYKMNVARTIYFICSVPDRWAEYCDERVCLCVCLFVRDHIFGTTRPFFTKFFTHVTCGRGSVLLWRRSDALRISGLADDVIFAYFTLDARTPLNEQRLHGFVNLQRGRDWLLYNQYSEKTDKKHTAAVEIWYVPPPWRLPRSWAKFDV